ncbi:MAG: glycoside hydrolase, partial [Actinobacteria bacterium]|nr:glycoside hydrolase [Actinomycetota bacterium]
MTGTGRFTANVPLGEPSVGLGRDVPGLAADPADANHVVEIDEDFGRGQCSFATTFDGGTTWTRGDLTVAPGLAPTADPGAPPCDAISSGGNAHSDQSVAFGSGANVYATFSSSNAAVVSRSSDGGRTWAPAVVAIGAPPVSGAADIRPQLAVEPRPEGDRIYVSALGPSGPQSGELGPRDPDGGGEPGPNDPDGGGALRLVTTRSEDGGSTWSPTVDAQGEGDQVREPAQPAVGPDGAVYVAWHSAAGASAGRVVVARSLDQGRTWTRAAAGDVPDSGGSPHLTAGATPGAVDLVYVGPRTGGTEISFQRSSDGGSSWSAPVRVSDDRPATRPVQHLVPRLAVAPRGRLDVVWLDTRSGYDSPESAPLGFGDIWYASSADGGKTFSTNRRVNDRSINLGPGAVSQSALTQHGPVLAELGDG